MCGTTALVHRKTPFRLTLMTASHASSLITDSGPLQFHFTSWESRTIPALLMRMSMRPHSLATAAAAVAKEWGRIDILINNAGIVRDSLATAAAAASTALALVTLSAWK